MFTAFELPATGLGFKILPYLAIVGTQTHL